MRCSKCGFDNPADSKLCSNCGAELEAPAQPATSTAFCPKCGSPVSSEAPFCSQCGAKLVNACPKCGSEVTPGTRFCRQCGQNLSGGVIRKAAQVAPGKQAFPLANTIAAGGAILMLIALAVPWYTLRMSGGGESYSENITLGDLLTPEGAGNPNWAGSGLPIVLIIICASMSLLSVGYALMSRSQPKKLWAWLGSLSIVCALSNLVYILWWVIDTVNDLSGGEVSAYTTPHAGFFLAFFGAIALVASSAMGRQNT